MQKEKNITINDLAIMIKRGFDTMATKDDLDTVKSDLDNLKDVVKDIAEELKATHANVRHTRTTADFLVRNDIAQDEAIENFTARALKLEQKTGLVRWQDCVSPCLL